MSKIIVSLFFLITEVHVLQRPFASSLIPVGKVDFANVFELFWNVKSSAEGVRGELLQLIDLVLGFNSAICVFIHKCFWRR